MCGNSNPTTILPIFIDLIKEAKRKGDIRRSNKNLPDILQYQPKNNDLSSSSPTTILPTFIDLIKEAKREGHIRRSDKNLPDTLQYQLKNNDLKRFWQNLIKEEV